VLLLLARPLLLARRLLLARGRPCARSRVRGVCRTAANKPQDAASCSSAAARAHARTRARAHARTRTRARAHASEEAQQTRARARARRLLQQRPLLQLLQLLQLRARVFERRSLLKASARREPAGHGTRRGRSPRSVLPLLRQRAATSWLATCAH